MSEAIFHDAVDVTDGEVVYKEVYQALEQELAEVKFELSELVNQTFSGVIISAEQQNERYKTALDEIKTCIKTGGAREIAREALKEATKE